MYLDISKVDAEELLAPDLARQGDVDPLFQPSFCAFSLDASESIEQENRRGRGRGKTKTETQDTRR